MSGILSRVPRRFASTWPKPTPEKWEKTMNLWRNISLFVAVPAIALVGVNTYLAEVEHAKHFERPEFVDYEHLRILNVPFPWGDGKHPLFFNKKVNATKDGYED